MIIFLRHGIYKAGLQAVAFLLLTLGNTLFAAVSTPYGDKIEAVMFDCDGVLVDTEYLKFLAWQEAPGAKDISFTAQEYLPAIGHSSKNILLMIEKLKNTSIPKEVIELKNARYQILQKQGVSPINEMIAFAKRFAEEKITLGIKLGRASSAPLREILENLAQAGPENCFDLIISGSNDLDDYVDETGKNKPKPYIYIEAAKRLNVSPSTARSSKIPRPVSKPQPLQV